MSQSTTEVVNGPGCGVEVKGFFSLKVKVTFDTACVCAEETGHRKGSEDTAARGMSLNRQARVAWCCP